jgi:transposase InsO family protein
LAARFQYDFWPLRIGTGRHEQLGIAAAGRFCPTAKSLFQHAIDNLVQSCPDDKISTSHIERFDLTVRMQLRRFTRLTNGYSTSLRHHTAMQRMFVAWYNFARKHETLNGNSPAMASNLTDHVWTIEELIERAGTA